MKFSLSITTLLITILLSGSAFAENCSSISVECKACCFIDQTVRKEHRTRCQQKNLSQEEKVVCEQVGRVMNSRSKMVRGCRYQRSADVAMCVGIHNHWFENRSRKDAAQTKPDQWPLDLLAKDLKTDPELFGNAYMKATSAESKLEKPSYWYRLAGLGDVTFLGGGVSSKKQKKRTLDPIPPMPNARDVCLEITKEAHEKHPIFGMPTEAHRQFVSRKIAAARYKLRADWEKYLIALQSHLARGEDYPEAEPIQSLVVSRVFTNFKSLIYKMGDISKYSAELFSISPTQNEEYRKLAKAGEQGESQLWRYNIPCVHYLLNSKDHLEAYCAQSSAKLNQLAAAIAAIEDDRVRRRPVRTPAIASDNDSSHLGIYVAGVAYNWKGDRCHEVRPSASYDGLRAQQIGTAANDLHRLARFQLSHSEGQPLPDVAFMNFSDTNLPGYCGQLRAEEAAAVMGHLPRLVALEVQALDKLWLNRKIDFETRLARACQVGDVMRRASAITDVDDPKIDDPNVRQRLKQVLKPVAAPAAGSAE